MKKDKVLIKFQKKRLIKTADTNSQLKTDRFCFEPYKKTSAFWLISYHRLMLSLLVWPKISH
jgi:hypothetical protein